MSGRCRIKELSDVSTMRKRPVDARRCHDDYRRTKRCHDDYRRTNAVTTMVDSRLRRSVSTKDALTLSPFLTGSRLHFRYYCWFFTCRATPKSNVAWMCVDLGVCCLCPFRPFTPVKAESSLLSGHSYSSLVSLLSLVSPHTLLSYSICIYLVVTENSSVFSLCCPFAHTTGTRYHTSTFATLCKSKEMNCEMSLTYFLQ